MARKPKNLPGAGLLNMRHTRHRPGPENISTPSTSVAVGPSPIYISLDGIPERDRDAFLTYPVEERESMLPIDLRVPLAPWRPWDSDGDADRDAEGDTEVDLLVDPPKDLPVFQALRTSPRKRKEKEMYEPEPFQKEKKKSPKTKHNKKGKEKAHTPSDEDLPSLNDPIAIERYQAKQQVDSQTPAPPHTPKKRRPGRQPDQHVLIGSRLTEDEDRILIMIALRYQAKYGVDPMYRFWTRVRAQFQKITKRTYASVERRARDLLEIRHNQLRREAESGHGHEARDDKWTKTMDAWDLVVQAYNSKKDDSKVAKKKKLQHSKRHDQARDSLNARLGNKNKGSRKVTIDISSGGSDSETSPTSAEDTHESTTNDESSTDEIHDDLLSPRFTSPPVISVQAVESRRDTPTPGPSNMDPPGSDLEAMVADIVTDDERTIPLAKKTPKKTKKPRRERKARGTTATELGIGDVTAAMTKYLHHMTNRSTAPKDEVPQVPQVNIEGYKGIREHLNRLTKNQALILTNQEDFDIQNTNILNQINILTHRVNEFTARICSLQHNQVLFNSLLESFLNIKEIRTIKLSETE